LIVTASNLRNGQVFLVFFNLRLAVLGRQDAFQCIASEREGDLQTFIKGR